MRTKEKKCGTFAALGAVLLVTAALVIGCPAGSPSSGYTPPPGMGAVRLNFSNEIARTLVPEDAGLSAFVSFDLTFAPTPASWGSGTIPVPYADREVPIPIDPGTYSLTVVGYLGAAQTLPAATADITSLPISSGANLNVLITLRSYDPVIATGTGVFSWDIDISGISEPTDINSAEIVFTRILGGATQANINLLAGAGNWTNTQTLTEGYYYVDFVIDLDGKEVTFRHVLHIYRSRTTVFEYAFTDKHFGIVDTFVSFDWDYEEIEDYAPTFTRAAYGSTNAVSGTGAKDSPILLSVSDDTDPSGITITITNAATVLYSYPDPADPGVNPDINVQYSSLVWYSGATAPLANGPGINITSNSITITTGAGSPFADLGVYQLAVVGIVNDARAAVPYYTYIDIEVQQ